MKGFGKNLSRLVSLIIITLFVAGVHVTSVSHTAKAQASSFADLYLDLPSNYLMETIKTDFSVEEYKLFESVFFNSPILENNKLTLQRSFFANNSKSFLLTHRATQQAYTLHLRILSLLVLEDENQNEVGSPLYLSGIQHAEGHFLFFIHWLEALDTPVAAVFYTPERSPIWQWDLSKIKKACANSFYRLYQQLVEDITENELEAERLHPMLSVLFSARMWTEYLDQYRVKVNDPACFDLGGLEAPKEYDELVQYGLDHCMLESTPYDWKDDDTNQILRCIEDLSSVRWDPSYSSFTYDRSYHLQYQEETLIFIPFIKARMEIGHFSRGNTFAGLKDSQGKWFFWNLNCFYFSDQAYLKVKPFFRGLSDFASSDLPYVRYLTILGAFIYQQVDQHYLPVVVLSYATSLLEANILQSETAEVNTDTCTVAMSSESEGNEGSFIAGADVFFRQFMERVSVFADNAALSIEEQELIMELLLTAHDLDEFEVEAYEFTLKNSYRLFEHDTRQSYRFVPYVGASVMLKDYGRYSFAPFSLLQTPDQNWVLRDERKVVFSSGFVSDLARSLGLSRQVNEVYLSYQLHYSYLLRNRIDEADLGDFALLMGALDWNEYFSKMDLIDEYAENLTQPMPLIQDLDTLSQYVHEHFSLVCAEDYQPCDEDKLSILKVLQERLKGKEEIDLDWTSLLINFSPPYQLTCDEGKVSLYFKRVEIQLEGNGDADFLTVQSWIKDDQGHWISFLPFDRIESSEGWAVSSVPSHMDDPTSVYRLYIGYFARTLWEYQSLPCHKTISLVCSIKLMNSASYVPAIPRAQASSNSAISNIVLTPQPRKVDAVATYRIEFALHEFLPKGSWIKIQFPEEFVFPETADQDRTNISVNPELGRVTYKLAYDADPLEKDRMVIVLPDLLGIRNPSSAGDYTIKIACEIDPGWAQSHPFKITESRIGEPEGIPQVEVSPSLAGDLASYRIVFKVGQAGALIKGEGMIRLRFPEGTVFSEDTLPAHSIEVNGTTFISNAMPRGNNLIFTTPIAIANDAPVEIVISRQAGIINPSQPGEYILQVSTMPADPEWVSSMPYRLD